MKMDEAALRKALELEECWVDGVLNEAAAWRNVFRCQLNTMLTVAGYQALMENYDVQGALNRII